MTDPTVSQKQRRMVGNTSIIRCIEWLKERERISLQVFAGFQFAVLLAMIFLHLLPHLTGETILLRVVPVDPRDFFRGDYVILSYDFSRVPRHKIEGIPHSGFGVKRQGQPVYVSLILDDDGNHWKREKVSFNPPASGKYIQGKYTGWNRINFGIESYYVQEGEGRKYEEAIRNNQLTAKVSLTKNGKALLQDLVIE